MTDLDAKGIDKIMKTMTCRQLGGTCDLVLRGTTADEVIKLQDKHLRAVVADGDDAHKEALAQMKGRWKHPIKGMGWYRDVKRDFAAQSEDEPCVEQNDSVAPLSTPEQQVRHSAGTGHGVQMEAIE
jgi:hypothetical protein